MLSLSRLIICYLAIMSASFSLTVSDVLEKIPSLSKFKQTEACLNFSTLPEARIHGPYYIQYAVYVNVSDPSQSLYQFAQEKNLLNMRPKIARMTSTPRVYFYFPFVNPGQAQPKDLKENGGHFNLSFTLKDGKIPSEADLPTLEKFLQETGLQGMVSSKSLWMAAEEKSLSFEHKKDRYALRYVYFDPENKDLTLEAYVKTIKEDLTLQFSPMMTGTVQTFIFPREKETPKRLILTVEKEN